MSRYKVHYTNSAGSGRAYCGEPHEHATRTSNSLQWIAVNCAACLNRKWQRENNQCWLCGARISWGWPETVAWARSHIRRCRRELVTHD